MHVLNHRGLSCDDAGELLSAALDGELEATEAAALDEHLAGCAGCAARGERLAEVRDAFRSLTPAAPPRDLASAVMERIRAGEAGEPPTEAAPVPASPGTRARRWTSTARVAAALLLIAGGAAALWTSRASDAGAPAAEPAPRVSAPVRRALGLDAGCGEGGNCLQLGPCDSPAECGGGPPCSDPAECGEQLR